MTEVTNIKLSDHADRGQAERFRPAYHYTPRRNWMNDPNGLVWFEGEYHLFYQYNPHGSDWGHMSWGHAVSADLVRWRELPVAIPEGDAMIFSGSAIVDHDNVSGLGDGTTPPILAYYTEHFPEPNRIERQCLAYSRDRGRSFQQYDGNPLIDIGEKNFRDPKVFYHAESEAWILVVALSQQHCIHIYRSTNLLDWQHASTFGPMGSTDGQWECTDLLYLETEGSSAEGRWVLNVDVDDGTVGGGSGSQYFVGHFDGYSFTVDPERGTEDGLIVDYGPDFYASATWSNLPKPHDTHVIIGWMSNQQSGHRYPTQPWRGTMSVPRELYLFEEAGLLKLGQRPIENVARLREGICQIEDSELHGGDRRILSSDLQSHEVQLSLRLSDNASAQLALTDQSGALVTVTFDCEAGQIAYERLQGAIDPQVPFARKSQSEIFDGEHPSVRILLDNSTVEIFLNDGRRVYSACVFPEGDMALSLECSKGKAEVAEVNCWRIARAD